MFSDRHATTNHTVMATTTSVPTSVPTNIRAFIAHTNSSMILSINATCIIFGGELFIPIPFCNGL